MKTESDKMTTPLSTRTTTTLHRNYFLPVKGYTGRMGRFPTTRTPVRNCSREMESNL